jgi:hypothetical protein
MHVCGCCVCVCSIVDTVGRLRPILDLVDEHYRSPIYCKSTAYAQWVKVKSKHRLPQPDVSALSGVFSRLLGKYQYPASSSVSIKDGSWLWLPASRKLSFEQSDSLYVQYRTILVLLAAEQLSIEDEQFVMLTPSVSNPHHPTLLSVAGCGFPVDLTPRLPSIGVANDDQDTDVEDDACDQLPVRNKHCLLQLHTHTPL